MRLENSFRVPAGIEATRQILLDADRVAACLPGATVEAIHGDEVTGALRFKLGALAVVVRGRAHYLDQDADKRRLVITATGSTRGNGSATAELVANLSAYGDSTRVVLTTDLELTGKIALIERLTLIEVSDRVVHQFALNVAAMLEGRPPSPLAEPPEAALPEAAPLETAEPVPPEAALPADSERPEDAARSAPDEVPAGVHETPITVRQNDPIPAKSSQHPAEGGALEPNDANRWRFAPTIFVVVFLVLYRRHRRRGR